MLDIYSRIVDYLRIKKGIKISSRTFTCPICGKLSAHFIPNTSYKISCMECGVLGNILSLVRLIEPEYKDRTDNELVTYLQTLLKIPAIPEKNLFFIKQIFKVYERFGFDMTPVKRGDKAPFELDWVNKEHKDSKEWLQWIKDTLNIGVKTGKKSGITVLDFDTEQIPEEIRGLLCKTLVQRTRKGWHYFFEYEADLPKTNLRHRKYKKQLPLDIENDGGQVVVFPSMVEGIGRRLLFSGETFTSIKIAKMPTVLKEYLLKLIKNEQEVKIVTDSTVDRELSSTTLNEGSRNDNLISIGGALRKQLNINDTAYALKVINTKFCTPPLPEQEILAISRNLKGYANEEERDLAEQVLKYINKAKEATEADICSVLKAYDRVKIVDALDYLMKEDKIYKSRRLYQLIKKTEWKTKFGEDGQEIKFKIPYFHDVAVFRNGDLAVIGAKTGAGKTYLSMNIIKQLVVQKIKPHYISLESGSRFITIAKYLGLKEGDFLFSSHFDPMQIKLEKDAVTIIDWILPSDYALTDKLYEHLNKELEQNGGLVIAFVQLRENNHFFAEDLIKFFPSFVCKFLYTDPEDTKYSYFITEKIRESKLRKQRIQINCVFNHDTKELLRTDETTKEKEVDSLEIQDITQEELA